MEILEFVIDCEIFSCLSLLNSEAMIEEIDEATFISESFLDMLKEKNYRIVYNGELLEDYTNILLEVYPKLLHQLRHLTCSDSNGRRADRNGLNGDERRMLKNTDLEQKINYIECANQCNLTRLLITTDKHCEILYHKAENLALLIKIGVNCEPILTYFKEGE